MMMTMILLGYKQTKNMQHDINGVCREAMDTLMKMLLLMLALVIVASECKKEKGDEKEKKEKNDKRNKDEKKDKDDGESHYVIAH